MLNVLINNQGTGGVPAVSFEPSAASTGASLIMTDVAITTTVGPGVDIKSVSGVPVSAILNRVTITDTQAAVQAEDGATVTIANSNLSNNPGRGVNALSTTLPVLVNVLHTTIANNTNFGVVANSNATVKLSDVSVFSNAAGLKVQGTGVILSFKNNSLGPDAGNSGLPTTTVVQQ
jgi:hypothetical protein